MMSEEESSAWETNEIPYVAALKCLGFVEDDMVFDKDANSVFWIFTKTPELLAAVTSVAMGEARVNPLEFNRFFTGAKDTMFDFMRAEGVRRSGRGN